MSTKTTPEHKAQDDGDHNLQNAAKQWGIASCSIPWKDNEAKENLIAETVEYIKGRIFPQHARRPDEYFKGGREVNIERSPLFTSEEKKVEKIILENKAMGLRQEYCRYKSKKEMYADIEKDGFLKPLQGAPRRDDLSHMVLQSIGDDSFFETVWKRFKTKFSSDLTLLFSDKGEIDSDDDSESVHGEQSSNEKNDVVEKIEQYATLYGQGIELLENARKELVNNLVRKSEMRITESTDPRDWVEWNGSWSNMRPSKTFNTFKKRLLNVVCDKVAEEYIRSFCNEYQNLEERKTAIEARLISQDEDPHQAKVCIFSLNL